MASWSEAASVPFHLHPDAPPEIFRAISLFTLLLINAYLSHWHLCLESVWSLMDLHFNLMPWFTVSLTLDPFDNVAWRWWQWNDKRGRWRSLILIWFPVKMTHHSETMSWIGWASVKLDIASLPKLLLHNLLVSSTASTVTNAALSTIQGVTHQPAAHIWWGQLLKGLCHIAPTTDPTICLNHYDRHNQPGQNWIKTPLGYSGFNLLGSDVIL